MKQLRSTAARALVVGACVLASITPVQATEPAPFPNRPITLVVTFAPGGGTDLLARKLAPVLHQALGQSVVVENRPGASGNIGASHVARAQADGHTLLMVNSSFAINPGVFGPLDFSPSRDFTPVFNVGFVPSVLVVPPGSPLRHMGDLLQAAKAPAAPMLFASCGAGTPQHLAGEMLQMAAPLRMAQVPYKGCGPALADVMSGQVGLGIVTASSAAPLLATAKLRALAVTSPQRTAQLPDVPTVAEQGLPGYELDQWHGLLAPAGTPEAVVQKLNQALAQGLADPALQAQLRGLGYTLTRGADMAPQAFGSLLARDLRRFGMVTAKLGLRVEQ
ncbi:tripartite tricarboxylate transporter substrate binding protein [Xenophilus arseniciresistens]|uniref:Tripartite tricarboxylate transporter substrate binding protein n=1 Tax=Xenophilus arseniciresistens TaxID=1283306 RepID=A0AAE3N8U8_9BURK|nr:tripartite tricarboxylate transporter substrate binding protein [Xenophilus arseniciresistens]MDA7417790.1 tripartite tricarboxylate transporter substrate binding protein [Xenophilus arseniciresistens]